MHQVEIHHAEIEECKYCNQRYYYTYYNYLHGKVTLCALHLNVGRAGTALEFTAGQAYGTLDNGP